MFTLAFPELRYNANGKYIEDTREKALLYLTVISDVLP